MSQKLERQSQRDRMPTLRQVTAAKRFIKYLIGQQQR